MNQANLKGDYEGYFGEPNYPSVLNNAFTPSGIAGSLQWRGIQSAPLREEFTFLDIGCGDGIGLCLIAAAYPQAQFVGVDAQPGHIETGQQFAKSHKINNIELHCQTFAEFLSTPTTEINAYDYITAQGVIAWVSASNRQLVFDIAGRYLRDGGAFTVGYNTQPGWQNKMSSQQVFLRFLGSQVDKTPENLLEDIAFLEALNAAGAKSISDPALKIIKGVVDEMPHEYILHEYLNEHWQPLWFGEVFTAMESRGLNFATHAGFSRLREDFCLRKVQRAAIEKIQDPLQRQTAMDILQNIQFRIDIFTKQAEYDKLQRARENIYLMVTEAQEAIEYTCLTAAGRLKFDNPATRDILQQVENGPRTLVEICNSSPFDLADNINAVETLLVAGHLRPVCSPLESNPAMGLNTVLVEYAVEHDQLLVNGLVSKYGVVAVKRSDFNELLDEQEGLFSSKTALRLGL